MQNEMAAWLWLTAASLCVGSFLNVVIYRLPKMILAPEPGYSLLLPRSHCTHCQQGVRIADLIPVVSWLLLRGRCRACGHAVSAAYPLIEAATAAIALLLAWALPWNSLLLAALLFSWMLLALTLIDVRHQLLPDALTLSLLWLGLAFQTQGILPAITLRDAVAGAIVGYASFWLLSTAYRVIYCKEALGGGDAKLLAALGAWLGWQALPMVVIIASSTGLVAALVARLVWQRPLHLALPFGPYLALAGFILFINNAING